MSALQPIAASARKGISLLEVLVACGILVVGLASVASILPAAGSRLSQATLEDRAAAAAAAAYAEMVNRDLVNSLLFTGSGGGASATRTCILGAFPSTTTGSVGLSSFQPAILAVVNARIDSTRGYVLEDDLVYTLPSIADTPNNSFFNGVSGPREYRNGLCWGAMLSTGTAAGAAGVPATLSIAIFKKPGNVNRFQLDQPSGSVYRASTASEDDRKSYLPGCSFVLALPTAANDSPRWFKINSSWNTSGTIFVSFADPGFPAFAGSNPVVVAFENIVRVDQYPVTLD